MTEINAGIPLAYSLGPTIGEHFGQAVKLADLMDQRKQRAVETNYRNQKAKRLEQVNGIYDRMMRDNQTVIEKRKTENLGMLANAVPYITDEKSYRGFRKWVQEHVGGDTSDMPVLYDDAKPLLAAITTGHRNPDNISKPPQSPYDVQHTPHIINQLKSDGLLPQDYQYKGPMLPFNPAVEDYEESPEQMELPQDLPTPPANTPRGEMLPIGYKAKKNKMATG